MKSTIWKVLAVTMAAATIACVGAGCAKNDQKGQESSATSAASSKDASKSDSKAASADASKTTSAEGSKAETSTESKAESAEESKAETSTESKAEESKTESAEESKEASTEESEESGTETEAGEQFLGSWEYDVGNKYFGLIINDDGSVDMKFADGKTLPASWTVEDGLLCVRAAGGLQKFEYVDGRLKDVDNGQEYLHVETLNIDQTSRPENENDDADAYLGIWEYNIGGNYSSLVINSDGTIEMKDTDGNVISARWTVESGTLCVCAAGGLQTFNLIDGSLEDTDTG